MGTKLITTLPKSGITLYDYQFDSMLEFLDYIKTKPKVTFSNSSKSVGLSHKIFSGTWTFGKAYKLCREGYFDKDVETFQSIFLNMAKQVDKAIHYTRTKHDIVGYTPDVPRYLSGHPLNMINAIPKTKPKRPKGINLRFNASMAWYVPKNLIEVRGLVFCILYDMLSKLRCDVELFVNEYSYIKEKDKHDFPKFNLNISIPIIKRGEMMNISKMYFPLVHPSFLRRLCFAFDERCPELKNRQEYFDGYGEVGHLRNFYQIKNERLNTGDRIDIVSDDYDTHLRNGVKATIKEVVLNLKQKGAVLMSEEAIDELFNSLDFSVIENIANKFNVDDYKKLYHKGFSDYHIKRILDYEPGGRDKDDENDI